MATQQRRVESLLRRLDPHNEFIIRAPSSIFRALFPPGVTSRESRRNEAERVARAAHQMRTLLVVFGRIIQVKWKSQSVQREWAAIQASLRVMYTQGRKAWRTQGGVRMWTQSVREELRCVATALRRMVDTNDNVATILAAVPPFAAQALLLGVAIWISTVRLLGVFAYLCVLNAYRKRNRLNEGKVGRFVLYVLRQVSGE